MIKYVIIVIIFGFVYESMSWTYRIFKSLSWIKRERSTLISGVVSNRKIFILIPVLDEADILEDTVDYFSKNFLEKDDCLHLVIITTEKENTIISSYSNTIDVAKGIIDKYTRVSHIHFPGRDGKMAHQLNFAVKKLVDTENMMRGDDVMAVYNADSRPEKETFNWVKDKLISGKYKVFQQYGCYMKNISNIGYVSGSYILIAGSLWQTRWSIGFEIYNALKQIKFLKHTKDFRLNYPFNYCVGHGLYMTRSVFDQIGGFNEKTHNEDAVLGLQLSDMQEIIMPIPYFDISESPDTLNMLYRQKSNWYFGPLQAYSYLPFVSTKLRYSEYRRFRLYILTTKLFFHAIYWIVGPTLISLILVLSIILRDIQLLIFSLLAFLLFSIPSIISYYFVTNLKITLSKNGILKTETKSTIGFFGFYIMHGVSAYNGLYRYVRQILSGKKAEKVKTKIRVAVFPAALPRGAM